jgi:plastocyanin
MTRRTRLAAHLRAHLSTATLTAAACAAPHMAVAEPAGHAYTVTISDMDFGATPEGAKVGDSIVWINNDTVLHSVTARDHSFDIRLNPGQKATMKLGAPGRIAFYCLFHPSMRGSLSVAPK